MGMNKTDLKEEKFQPKRKKKSKNKFVLTFDENARREFLMGFRKRKLQRKKKAMEEFEQQLKSERKRIKNESKEAFKKLLLQHKPVTELNLHSEEIDMGTHSVSVTELSTAELAKSNNWIGLNEVQYENEIEDDVGQSENDSELEGMEVKNKNKFVERSLLKNCRDIKKAIKKQATISVKNSKIFQKKTKIEKKKFIKKKKKEERKRKKLKKQKMQNK